MRLLRKLHGPMRQLQFSVWYTVLPHREGARDNKLELAASLTMASDQVGISLGGVPGHSERGIKQTKVREKDQSFEDSTSLSVQNICEYDSLAGVKRD